MTQRERDRLVVLKKAAKGLITQAGAAEELGVSVRQVRRMLVRLKERGDKSVIHGLKGRASNRELDGKVRQRAVKALSAPRCAEFGPTYARDYLEKKKGIVLSKETVRRWMAGAGLWRACRQKQRKPHVWRERRARVGELVQWDTSEHDWLEGRGAGKLYLISMIDDASSRLHAHFAEHDSTEENLKLLETYLLQYGRPGAFYTDKASLFRTAPKIQRDEKGLSRDEREPLPPTQIGRALRELDVVWIGAHSPQAKGRIERSFGTAQDRLVKDLRVAGVRTLEEANRLLKEEFIPWWNRTLTVKAREPEDMHRALDRSHDLKAVLSHVEQRTVAPNYTVQFKRRFYAIERSDIRSGLRGADVRVEQRRDGTVAIRFGNEYLRYRICTQTERPGAEAPEPAASQNRPAFSPKPRSTWMKDFRFASQAKLTRMPVGELKR